MSAKISHRARESKQKSLEAAACERKIKDTTINNQGIEWRRLQANKRKIWMSTLKSSSPIECMSDVLAFSSPKRMERPRLRKKDVRANPNLFSIWKIMEIYTLYEHKFSFTTSGEDKSTFRGWLTKNIVKTLKNLRKTDTKFAWIREKFFFVALCDDDTL